jgi:hypothetical protein
MEMSFDRILAIVGIGLAILGIAIGVGTAIAVDPKSKGELIFSICCFIFSGLILCLTVGAWGFFTTTSTTKRILILISAFAGICLSMVEASRWANGRYHRVETVKIREPEKPADPFLFDLDVWIGNPSRSYEGPFWYAYNSSHGKTLSPIHSLILLRLQNLQSAAAVIASYSVEGEVAPDKWVPLVKMDTLTGVFYATVNNNFKEAMRCDMRNGFDVLLTARAIPPKEPVLGWAAFEYPKAAPNLPARFRLAVSDTLGAKYSVIRKVPKPSESSTLGGALIGAGVDDISSYHRKYYDEP